MSSTKPSTNPSTPTPTLPSPEPAKSALKDIAYGSIAGMVSKAFEHPFDLVKVRLQSQPLDQPLRFKGPLDCFRDTVKNEGFKGLYRGISMPLVGAMAENAVLFLTYNQIQNLIRLTSPPSSSSSSTEELSIPQKALAAAGAGACASFVLTPIELVKCRMQVQLMGAGANPSAAAAVAGAGVVDPTTASSSSTTSSTSSSSKPSTRPILSHPISTSSTLPLNPNHPSTSSTSTKPKPAGPLQIALSTLNQHGIRGLWLGQTGTLLRETGGGSAWFTSFEVVSKFFINRRERSGQTGSGVGGKVTKKDLSVGELCVAGATAGMSYNVVLFPADSVKSAIQTEEELRNKYGGAAVGGKRIGFWETGMKIYRKRGLKGLYSGCGITVARAAPSSAMIFCVYELCERRFG